MWLKFSYDRSSPKDRSSGLRNIFENTTAKDDVIVRMSKTIESQEVAYSYVEAFLYDVWVQTNSESIFLGAIDEYESIGRRSEHTYTTKSDGRILSPYLASHYGYSALQTESGSPRQNVDYLTFYRAKGGDPSEIDKIEEAFHEEAGYRDIEASPDSGPDGWVAVRNDSVLHASVFVEYTTIIQPKREIEDFREVSSFLEHYRSKNASKGIFGLYENENQIVVYESRQFVVADTVTQNVDAVGVQAMGPKRSFWFSSLIELHTALRAVVDEHEAGGYVDRNTRKSYYTEIATNPDFLARASKVNGKYDREAAKLGDRVFRAADDFLAGKPATLKNASHGTKDFKLVSCPAGFKFLKNTRRKITLTIVKRLRAGSLSFYDVKQKSCKFCILLTSLSDKNVGNTNVFTARFGFSVSLSMSTVELLTKNVVYRALRRRVSSWHARFVYCRRRSRWFRVYDLASRTRSRDVSRRRRRIFRVRCRRDVV